MQQRKADVGVSCEGISPRAIIPVVLVFINAYVGLRDNIRFLAHNASEEMGPTSMSFVLFSLDQCDNYLRRNSDFNPPWAARA